MLFLVALVVAPGGCDGVNPFAAIFGKIGEDLNDTNKYAERMMQQILEKPECQKYKDKFFKDGREAKSMNGTFTTLIVENKNAANKAGCSKA